MKFKTLALATISALSLAACSQVHPGEGGVKIHQYGSGAGVDPQSLGVGTYLTGFGTSVERYPTSTKTYAWTAGSTEGSATNEEISFQDRNGMNLTADVGITLHADQARLPVLYNKFHMDIQQIVDGPLRNAVRQAIVSQASTLPVEEIYGQQKTVMLRNAEVAVRNQFAPYGIDVEGLQWLSNIRVPPAIQQQITLRVANENAALAAQAAVATATANANARIAQAEGEAKANQLLAQSIQSSPQIVQLKAIERWNGELPTTMAGGAVPFLNVK